MFRYLILASLALMGACSHTQAPLTLQSAAQCPVNLTPGQKLVLTLPSHPSTGYSWHLDASAHSQLGLISKSLTVPESSNMLGTQGVSVWQFEALKPSEGHLVLHYQRPWETEPVESFECRVQIQ